MKYPAILKKKICELYDFRPRETVDTSSVDKQIVADFRGSIKRNKAYEVILKKMSTLPSSKAFVGIEVELEQAPQQFYHSGWLEDKDGSLREGGKEYISFVLDPQIVNREIAALYTGLTLSEPEPQFSWRTSIHVHLCVRDRTIEEVLKIFLLYLTFERILFLFADQNREKSVFCVPIIKSSLAEDLSLFFTQKNSIDHLVKNWHKYSALNLTRLDDYGTMEFRHLSGTWDVAKISNWIGILLSLYNSAIRLNLDDIIEEIRTLNATSKYMMFRDEIFGEFAQELAIPNFDLVSEGVSFCKECLSGINQHTIEENSSIMKYVKRERNRRRELLRKQVGEDRKAEKPQAKKLVPLKRGDQQLRNLLDIPNIDYNKLYINSNLNIRIDAGIAVVNGPEVPF